MTPQPDTRPDGTPEFDYSAAFARLIHEREQYRNRAEQAEAALRKIAAMGYEGSRAVPVSKAEVFLSAGDKP